MFISLRGLKLGVSSLLSEGFIIALAGIYFVIMCLCYIPTPHASLQIKMGLYSKMWFVFFSFQPPLVQAIFNGDPDEVRALIFKKEDVNFQVKTNIISFGHILILV